MSGITNLTVGGLIVNYRCEADCEHCMYLCSANRKDDYITPEQAQVIFTKLRPLGCENMHISGGEPFLHPEKLFAVLETAQKCGMPINYIETSASWCNDEAQVRDVVKQAAKLGLSNYSIAVSPYHNGSIPADKLFMLSDVCRELDISHGFWQDEFLTDITVLPTDQVHTLCELEEHFGKGYIKQIAPRFGMLRMAGRALITQREYMPTVPLSRVPHMHRSCAELIDRTHFHVDLYGRYIPPGCVGLSLPVEALGEELDAERFPLTAMLQQGPRVLLDHCRKLGFQPAQNYNNRCHLCFEMRYFLWKNFPGEYEELTPDEFYLSYERELAQANAQACEKA